MSKGNDSASQSLSEIAQQNLSSPDLPIAFDYSNILGDPLVSVHLKPLGVQEGQTNDSFEFKVYEPG